MTYKFNHNFFEEIVMLSVLGLVFKNSLHRDSVHKAHDEGAATLLARKGG